MAIKMVREPSETPNINNIDDIIPFRYAYGGQNGYVIGKGTEISNTVNGLNFTINSGRLVVQGVECDIDASGVTITIDNIATKRYYVIYLEVNLGLNSATIKNEYDTATYPSIDAGDDLTENTTGVARLPLYRFVATSGVIGEVNKVVESVKYVNQDFIKNVKVNNAENSDKVNNLEIKQDENGILKIGDIIIPQKQVLWTGSLKANTNVSSTYITTTSESLLGKSIELTYTTNSGDTLVDKFKIPIDASQSWNSERLARVDCSYGEINVLTISLLYNSNNNQLSFRGVTSVYTNTSGSTSIRTVYGRITLKEVSLIIE